MKNFSSCGSFFFFFNTDLCPPGQGNQRLPSLDPVPLLTWVFLCHLELCRLSWGEGVRGKEMVSNSSKDLNQKWTEPELCGSLGKIETAGASTNLETVRMKSGQDCLKGSACGVQRAFYCNLQCILGPLSGSQFPASAETHSTALRP